MASQAKVTLLIETKFEKFQELKKAGRELQEALGVGKIAKEYEKLDSALGKILDKIKQINQASGKSGLLGGGGAGPITGSHGARGGGGGGRGGGVFYEGHGGGGAVFGPQQSAWRQYTPGKAMEAGFGQFHTTHATVKGIVRDQMAPPALKGAAYRAEHAAQQAIWGNEVYPGYQDRRYGIGEGNTASPLRDPYVGRTSDLRPAFAGVTTARAGVAGANVQQTINQREQAGIKSQMIAQQAEAARLRAAQEAAAQARLQGQVAAVRDAQARANPIIGGALARGLRAASPEARAAALRSSQLAMAGKIGGAGFLFGGAASAGGAMLMGGLGGAGGAGQVGSGVGSAGFGLAGGALGFLLGGPLGAMAGATAGSMFGGSVGGTFGGIGGQVAQYGTKGLQLQEVASQLAVTGFGISPTPVSTRGGMQTRRGTGGTVDYLLGAKEVATPARTETIPGSIREGVPDREVTIPAKYRRTGGVSTMYGYSVDQIASMAAGVFAGARAAPNAQTSAATADWIRPMQQLQRNLGVGIQTQGQLAFGLMREGGNLKTFGDSALDYTSGMTPGEAQGFFGAAGRMMGAEFARTGISGRRTVANMGAFTSGRGRSGFRATQFAEGAVNYGRNIAQRGPQSPYDYALVSALAGGGGVSPTELLDIYKGLETGDILKSGTMRDRFMGYLKSVRGSAGGDKGLETITLNKALQPILPGLGLEATERAMGMIEGGKSWDAIVETVGRLDTRGKGLSGLGNRATKQMQRAADIRNKSIALGTQMLDTMQAFQEAAEKLADNLKKTAPIMAEMNRRIADSFGTPYLLEKE